MARCPYSYLGPQLPVVFTDFPQIHSMNMKEKIIDIYNELFGYDSMLTRFKRAKSETTLDTMYQGALRKAEAHLQGKELFQAQLAIERALDQCQQAFDTSQIGMIRKVNHALKQADEPCKKYNPEDELRRLLNGLD